MLSIGVAARLRASRIRNRSSVPLCDKAGFEAPIRLVPGELYSEKKRQGREAHHLTLSSAGINNGGGIPPLPLYVLLIN
jgi:hypothetical protein